MLNLIRSAWLPVRLLDGTRTIIAPYEMTRDWASNRVTRLDFGRPDFDGAVSEFLIGLLSLAFPIYSTDDEDACVRWKALWDQPPGPDDLRTALEPYAPVFDLSGPTACFQDFDLLEEQDVLPLTQLLIGAPGEQTAKNNADLFQKVGARDFADCEIAAALITLQTYAPSGGAGHRTSMRGGGPLTTLVRGIREGEDSVYSSLWDRLWPNVLDQKQKNLPTPDDAKIFPWLAPAITSAGKTVCTPEDAHPLQVFFATPRRLRLVFDGDGACVGYRTRNYGTNYEGWIHPLSPYYEDQKKQRLPLHPKEGPALYRDWLALLKPQFAAQCLHWAQERFAGSRGRARIDDMVEAFGFDMDNMKARGWMSQSLPFYHLDEGGARAAYSDEFYEVIQDVLGFCDTLARAIRLSVQIAHYGRWEDKSDGKSGVFISDGGKKSFHEAAHAFWRQSEPDFRVFLEALARDVLSDLEAERKPVIEPFTQQALRCARRVRADFIDEEALLWKNPRLWGESQRQFQWATSSRNTKSGVFVPLEKRGFLDATVKDAKNKEKAPS